MKQLILLFITLLLVANIYAQWQQTSGPVGGDIYSIASDGTNTFVGTLRGGIFLSTNNGTSWTAVNNGVPPLIDVNSIAISGSNIYAGYNSGTNGGYDGGVLLSTDNGASWAAVNNGLNNAYVTSIAISASNIFAGTTTGLYLSTNNGSSWTSVLYGLNVSALAVIGSNIFAGTSGNGVYRSNDNGSNWTAINNGLTSSYTYIKSFATSGTRIFTNTNERGGFFSSSNNGNNWIPVNYGVDNSFITSIAISGSNIFAGYQAGAYDCGVLLSTNNGSSWNAVNNGLPSTSTIEILAICGTNIFAGANTKGIFLSTNNGGIWTKANNGLANATVFSLATNGTNIFATSDNSSVFLSTNNGSNWIEVNNGLPSDLYAHVTAVAASGANIFVGTMDKGVYLSTNNGSSWIAVNNGFPPLAQVSSFLINRSDIYAITYIGVFLSHNNGSNWSAVTCLGSTITSLAINETNIFAGTYDGGVLLSTDNGNTWNAVNNGLTDLNVGSLTVCNGNIYAGTFNAGIFLSTNNGSSWTALNNGFANYSPAYWRFITKGNNIFASRLSSSINDDGVFLLSEGASNWVSVNNGFRNRLIESFTVIGDNIFAGIYHEGVWIRPLSEMIDLPIVYPKISLNTAYANIGQNINIAGSDFTANHKVIIKITGAGGFSQSNMILATNTGHITNSFVTNTSMVAGIYNVQATDSISNKSTIIKTFQLINNGPPGNGYLHVICPRQNLTIYANDNINIEWQDKMVLGSNYVLNGSKRNYKYTIDFSPDNGVNWHMINTVQGWEYINTIKTFQIPTSFIDIGSSYLVRVTDYYKNINVDVTDNFSVINQTTSATNIKAELKWDFSYTNQNNTLLGLAADGAARVYLVVSKINNGTGGSISNVTIQLADGINSTTSALGKVLAAAQVSLYNEEANTANSLTATQNTEASSGYWFWYVAPDNFVGNDPNDVTQTYRVVTANISINYNDGTTETFDKSIKIVRPPLCFAHGLASDPDTWEYFRHNALGYNVNFLNDSRFYTKKAIQLDAKVSFNLNAQYLIIGFGDPNSTLFQNSIQGVIKDLRNKGYATNRCDYIGHSMGGCVLRYALEHYSPYFYRSGTASNLDYKNYGLGYINKFVTINTPHNSSPWADILNRYTPDLTFGMRLGLQLDYNYYPNSLPFSFITQANSYLVPTFKIVDAVRDLQIDEEQGGVNFGTTNLNTHLIASDFYPGIQNSSNNLIPQSVINFVDDKVGEVDFLNKFLELTIAEEQDQQVVSDLIEVTNSFDNPVQTALEYIEYMADLYNTSMFIPESDLVVSVNSQLAGYPRLSAPNVSVFDNYLGHAFIRPVLGDIEVGNRVNELLNAPINSNEFDIINATNNKEHRPSLNQLLGNKSSNIVVSEVDTLKLKILNPISNSYLVTDSIFNIKILLSDTSNLISYKVKFQNKTYKLPKVADTTDLNVQINSNLLDRNYIYAEAFFKYPDTSFFYFDSVSVNIETTSQLLDFSAEPKIMYIAVNQTKTPDYVCYYSDFITYPSTFSQFITGSVDNSSIVFFNPLNKSFSGVFPGETFAIISYDGLSDTLYFVVNEMEIDTILNDNKTLDLTSLLLEGLYNGTNSMRQAYNGSSGPRFPAPTADKISVELHDALNFENVVYLDSDVNLSTSGTATINVPSFLNGSYYITIKHRNSIGTTSSAPVSFSGGTIRYTFDAPSEAYGDNLHQMIDGVYAIYGGDVNQDGIVDTDDMLPIDNLSSSYATGYIPEDSNGDGMMDTGDMIIVDNNSSNYVSSMHP